jgi:Transposase DDE domain
MLQGDRSGPTRLGLTCRTLFGWERGDLILDDTVIPKPVATALESLAWVFSSQEHKPVYGFSRVWLVWTNGTLRLPLGVRLWRQGGPSKYQLALALRSSARHRLRCRPEYVLFDAWYPSKALLKRMRDDGWYVVCRPQRNRRFNGQALRAYRRPPYWAATGWRTGGWEVVGVRYGAKYVATNRLTLSAAEVRRLYRGRSQVEAVMKVCKEQLRVTGGQARSARAQLHHLACCLVAFGVLERERHERQLSIDTLKRQLSSRSLSVALPTLERLKRAA